MSQLKDRSERRLQKKEEYHRFRSRLLTRLDKAHQVRFISGLTFGATSFFTVAANWGWIDVNPAPFQTLISVQWETTLGLGAFAAALIISQGVVDATHTRLNELDAANK